MRKKVKFEEGIYKVTLRSLKEEIVCFPDELCLEEMVRSGLKTWYMLVAVEVREGYDRESEELEDLMR